MRNKLKIQKPDIVIYSEMICSLPKMPLNKIYETTKTMGEKITLDKMSTKCWKAEVGEGS